MDLQVRAPCDHDAARTLVLGPRALFSKPDSGAPTPQRQPCMQLRTVPRRDVHLHQNRNVRRALWEPGLAPHAKMRFGLSSPGSDVGALNPKAARAPTLLAPQASATPRCLGDTSTLSQGVVAGRGACPSWRSPLTCLFCLLAAPARRWRLPRRCKPQPAAQRGPRPPGRPRHRRRAGPLLRASRAARPSP